MVSLRVPSPIFYKKKLWVLVRVADISWTPIMCRGAGRVLSALCAVVHWMLKRALRDGCKGDSILGMRELRHREVKSQPKRSGWEVAELGFEPGFCSTPRLLPWPRPQALLQTSNNCCCFYFILCTVSGERLEQLGNPRWLWAKLLLPKA